jgi:hypothetical protein
LPPYKVRAVITAVGEMVAAGWIEKTSQSRGRYRNSIKLTTPSNPARAGAGLREAANPARQERQPCTVDASNPARRNSHVADVAAENFDIRVEIREEIREETVIESESILERESAGAEEAPPPLAPAGDLGEGASCVRVPPTQAKPTNGRGYNSYTPGRFDEGRPTKLAKPLNGHAHGPEGGATEAIEVPHLKRVKSNGAGGTAGKCSPRGAGRRTLLPDGWRPRRKLSELDDRAESNVR